MLTMEINPNHPVTKETHDHWHKIAALLLLKITGGQRNKIVRISVQEIQSFIEDHDGDLGAIVLQERGDYMELRMVDSIEANRLAKQEGGLPV
jgi:hypothetical protein